MAFAVLSLVACEQEIADPSPPRMLAQVDAEEPCSLLTPEQVGEAIGTQIRSESEVDSHDPNTRICSYKTTAPWTSVSISLETDFSTEEWAKEVKQDPVNTEPVAGIGDGTLIHACASIAVFEADALVWASVQHLTTCDETSVVLKALGRTIVDTLDQTS